MNTTRHPIPVNCSCSYPNGRPATITVPGEPVAPGLAITPRITNGAPVDGQWALTHIPSGLAITPLDEKLTRDDAQVAARVAIASGVDWDRPGDAVRADPAAQRARVDIEFNLAMLAEAREVLS